MYVIYTRDDNGSKVEVTRINGKVAARKYIKANNPLRPYSPDRLYMVSLSEW